MIKNDFEKLNQDDWLAKEIARENRISAWDLDEGKAIRQEHERDCDARKNAEEHHQKHLRADASGKIVGRLSAWFFIDLIAVFVMFFVNIWLPGASLLPSIILFLALNPGIFVWLFLLKRYPTAGYLRAVFFIAVLLEIMTLLNSNYSKLRFFLWRLFR